jgi:hypothetical protein
LWEPSSFDDGFLFGYDISDEYFKDTMDFLGDEERKA